MRTPRLFVDSALETGTLLDLPPSQSHYVRNVLRVRANQPLVLFNGRGGEFASTVVAVERSVVRVQLAEFRDDNRESPLKTHLALAITKRDAMDTAIQKATELGATELTPVLTEFNATSQKSLEKRFLHWQGVIRSAAEQCERNLLPELNPVVPFNDFVAHTEAELKLIAHPGEARPLAQETAPASIAVIIGPEGGFSDAEIEKAASAGFLPLGLGPRILRAETAPLVILALVQSTWGDLN